MSLTIATSTMGTLVYECDRYGPSWKTGSIAWKENLRAIALGLEALRRVERYGIAKRGQQYAGFAGLPAGTATDDDVILLEEVAGYEIDDIYNDSERKRLVRNALGESHPDTGGEAATFIEVQQAADRLADRFGT